MNQRSPRRALLFICAALLLPALASRDRNAAYASAADDDAWQGTVTVVERSHAEGDKTDVFKPPNGSAECSFTERHARRDSFEKTTIYADFHLSSDTGDSTTSWAGTARANLTLNASYYTLDVRKDAQCGPAAPPHSSERGYDTTTTGATVARATVKFFRYPDEDDPRKAKCRIEVDAEGGSPDRSELKVKTTGRSWNTHVPADSVSDWDKSVDEEETLAPSFTGVDFDCDPRSAAYSGRKKTQTSPNVNDTEVVTWNIHRGPEDLEVVVEPEGYEQWSPEGGEDENHVGNHIAVRAHLQGTDGKAPREKAVKFRYELVDTSRVPGVCGNGPRAAGTDYDMRIDGDPNPKLTITDELAQQQAETEVGEFTEGVVVVSSYDWGGYSRVKVTAQMRDGLEIVGYLKSDKSQTEIRLPKRAADSLIADAWKKQQQVEGRPDADDGETEPQTVHAGDGLSLYEEYRGFLENGHHIFGNPKRNELFIVDRIGERSKDGIALFENATHLVVHHQLQPNEADENGIVNGNYNAQIPHLTSAYAVRLTSASRVGASWAEGSPGYPKTVEISASWDSGPDGWNNAWGGRIISDDYASVIAHEILHTCAVSHHGDTDPGRKSWVIEKDDLGLQEFKEYAIDKDGATTGSGQVIRVLTEDGLRVSAHDLALPQTMWVAIKGGQHSGMEDCVMRYAAADAYVSPSDPSVRYLVDGEMAGLTLCENPRGTGVNDPGRKPRPRYGAATLGNCRSQVCVNDRFPH